MLFLHKIIALIFLPLGIVLLLLLFVVIRKKRWPVVVALLILYLASIPLVGRALIGNLETRYRAVTVNQVEMADAIVVLGGIFGPPVDEGMMPNISETTERLEAGIILMRARKATTLVFTGGRLPWRGQVKLEGNDAKNIAIQRGVPADQIVVTREVGNTADEAQAVAELMQTHHWHRVILVTTGWHMPRATMLFKRASVDHVRFPVDFRADPQRPLTLLDFLPCADGLANTETALREFYGYTFYALSGR